MKSAINIAIAGAHGCMGRALAAALVNDTTFAYVGGFGRAGSEGSGLIDRSAAIEAADVIVDFTVGSATAELAELCATRAGPALVIGATGFEPDELARISNAARTIPIVRAGNFSIGVNFLAGLVAQVARQFAPDVWDIEITEAHHRRKVDAPSGTALMLGEAAALGREVSLASVERRTRDGISEERRTGEIGFSVMRGGGIVGDHSVVFAALDETLTLSHSALDRGMFARGALAAARWIVDRKAGEYDMQDVLSLRRH